MFPISDLFRWERLHSRGLVRLFYWFAVVMSVLLGLAGIVNSFVTMTFNPFLGSIFLVMSLLGACIGVMLARIMVESFLIVFRIENNLRAIMNRTQSG